MLTIRRIADRLIGLSAVLGSIGLLFEVTVVLVDVIGRAFGHPLLGSQDLITMGMVIVVFGAMAICDRSGGHIVIDVFENHLPQLFNRMVDIVSALLGAVIFVMIAWTVYESARLSVMLNLSTNLLNLPKAWFQGALCAFSLLTALGMILRAMELAAGIRDVRREDFTG
jgi:TRAP-type C4-dicarboxylate transport system permease small subunit